MKFALVTLITAFSVLGGYLVWHLGAYKSAEVHGLEERSFTMLYREHVGPYHEIMGTLTDVEQWARKHQVPCAQTFGLFIDDPQKVEPDRLRSHVGCLTPETVPNPAEGMLARVLENRQYLHLSFSGSPSIGPFKVYSVANEWLRDNRYILGGPVLEVYTVTRDGGLTTDYYFPVSP